MRLLASQSAADKSLSETKSCMLPMPKLRRNRMFAAVNLMADSCRSIGNVDQLQPLHSGRSRMTAKRLQWAQSTRSAATKDQQLSSQLETSSQSRPQPQARRSHSLTNWLIWHKRATQQDRDTRQSELRGDEPAPAVEDVGERAARQDKRKTGSLDAVWCIATQNLACAASTFGL